MGLMYAWATKEYLLWKMTIGQIVMYYNLGLDIKNGDNSSSNPMSMKGKTRQEVKAKRQELIDQGYIKETKESEETKEKYRSKYGDI